MGQYTFNVEKTTEELIQWIKDWFEDNGKECKAILGISGGKDSTIAAKLCIEAIGKDRVVGVAMPDYNQGLNDADKICEYLGIKLYTIPIGDMCKAEQEGIGKHVELSQQAIQNIPPRIRMTTLYGLSQSIHGRVVNTCNLSEDIVGYFTRFGDECGDFSPLGNLTVTEILAIGDYLGLPKEWVHKTPDDGLPFSDGDEVKLGFTYANLDKHIRGNGTVSEEDKEKMDKRIKANAFKLRPMAKF